MRKLFFFLLILSKLSFAQTWDSIPLPEMSHFRDFIVHNDTLFCTGAFESEYGVAIWDSLNYSRLGNGFPLGGSTECSEFFNGKLVIGGGG